MSAPSAPTPNHNVLISSHDIDLWREQHRPGIGTADWLTGPLVEGGILSEDFYGARVAPIVVGVGRPHKSYQKGGVPSSYIKAGIDTNYLTNPPEDFFNPHNLIKGAVRKVLEDRIPGKKDPTLSLYAGYVFPDVAGGTVLLDGTLSDENCTVNAIKDSAGALGVAFDLGNISIGNQPVLKNEYGFTPEVALPSLLREAIEPNARGRIEVSPDVLRAAKQVIRRATI